MNMKKASLALLAMLTLCGTKGYAKQDVNSKETYPASWHMGSSFDIGMIDYRSLSFVINPEGSDYFSQQSFIGPKLSVAQNLGYKSWFNLRLRASGATNLPGLSYLGGYPFASKVYLFNLDAYLFFPVCIKESIGLSLLPVIGWGLNQVYARTIYIDDVDSQTGNLKDQHRFSAPLAGLYLELVPTDRFSIKGGFTVHLPTSKSTLSGVMTNAIQNHLKARRHGMGADLELSYKVSCITHLTAKWDYLALGNTGHNYTTLDASQTSYSVGIKIIY